MNDQNYTVKLKLSNYFGARVMTVENDEGFLEECLVIPIEQNDIYVAKNKDAYCQVYMTKTMNGNLKGWTHYLRMKVGKARYKKLLELGYEIPYLGNAKPSSWDTNIKAHNNYKVKNDLGI